MLKQLNRSDAFTGYTCGQKNVAGDKDKGKEACGRANESATETVAL